MPNAILRPRRLQAQPALASRFAVHPSAKATIQRALADLPQEVSVDALSAAYDQWLEGTIATTIEDGIATIPVRGVLTKGFSFWNYWFGWSSYEQIAHDLEFALASPEVRGIILAIDSPGGQVDSVAELGARVFAARESLAGKPIIAHVDGMAASAAYWIASAASQVFMAPTAMAGSIGVVFSFTDWSGAYEQLGVKSTEIISTQSPKKLPDPFTDEGRAQIQVHADAIAEVFLAAVATHRGTSRDAVAASFGQGDVFVGQSAVDASLADGLSTYQTTRRDLVARLDLEEAETLTLQVSRQEARANPARVLAAVTAVVHAACAIPTTEDSMAGQQPTRRSAAADPVDDEKQKPQDGADGEGTPVDDEEQKQQDGADGEDPPVDDQEQPTQDEESDPEAAALEGKHGPVLARIRSRAAAAERTRIAGIRALGHAGQGAVVQACIDDESCSVEQAALRLLKHEQGKRAAHLRGVQAEDDGLPKPDNRAAPDASSDASIAGSISALYHQHNPKRRPSAAGRA